MDNPTDLIKQVIDALEFYDTHDSYSDKARISLEYAKQLQTWVENAVRHIEILRRNNTQLNDIIKDDVIMGRNQP